MAKRQRQQSPQAQWVEPADGRKLKLKRITPRDKLDATIDWYEKYKPEMPHVMPGGVFMTADELNKFAAKMDADTWSYRTWTLRRADPPAKGRDLMKIAK